jgi:hypothetical protein
MSMEHGEVDAVFKIGNTNFVERTKVDTIFKIRNTNKFHLA